MITDNDAGVFTSGFGGKKQKNVSLEYFHGDLIIEYH